MLWSLAWRYFSNKLILVITQIVIEICTASRPSPKRALDRPSCRPLQRWDSDSTLVETPYPSYNNSVRVPVAFTSRLLTRHTRLHIQHHNQVDLISSDLNSLSISRPRSDSSESSTILTSQQSNFSHNILDQKFTLITDPLRPVLIVSLSYHDTHALVSYGYITDTFQVALEKND